MNAWRSLGVCFGLGLAMSASAQVYGLKTLEPVSGPPTTMYRFAEDGSSFTTIGQVRVGGVPVDVDAMAMSETGALFAYVLDGTTSQLVSLDPSSGAATPIGASLADRNVRGAVIDSSGRLLVVDVNQDELLEINPVTGAIVGSPIAIMLGGEPLAVSSIMDLAIDRVGRATLSNAGELYRFDLTTGTAVFESDGAPDAYAGLAHGGDVVRTLFAYDVIIEDDILILRTGDSYARSVLFGDIIASYNAGRGDLAKWVRVCVADWNGDGIENTADFVTYLNDFNAVMNGNAPTFGSPDLVAPVGILNTADFIAYLNAFNAGCP